jgi:hypothetical protein
MKTFAVQYLESPYPNASPEAVRLRLRQACERMPISLVLLGWELPTVLEEAVAEETVRQHAQLYRWQPILTGDAHTDLPPEWATLGVDGHPIPGHANLPEFTFICPNRSAVADFLSERLESVAASGLYQGIFLDRIRYPSPAIDPCRDLACFCQDCTRQAADAGLDLEQVKHTIQSLSAEVLVRSLLGEPDQSGSLLEVFLDFRNRSISRTVRTLSRQIQSHNLAVGLDCFTPALTRMVGQDLSALDGYANWVKIMTYPRVFGPAGISFELLGLSEWLIRHNLGEADTMRLLAKVSQLPIPSTKAELANAGLDSDTLRQEIRRGFELGITNLLAGIATVQMKEIHESTPQQIQADLKSSRAADGLVISWDLWLTPLNYLDTIRNLWS